MFYFWEIKPWKGNVEKGTKQTKQIILGKPKFSPFEQCKEKNPKPGVRTSFDLDPTQEWIQAHVAQTMNL